MTRSCSDRAVALRLTISRRIWRGGGSGIDVTDREGRHVYGGSSDGLDALLTDLENLAKPQPSLFGGAA
jgi:hypothetical protein